MYLARASHTINNNILIEFIISEWRTNESILCSDDKQRIIDSQSSFLATAEHTPHSKWVEICISCNYFITIIQYQIV